MGKITDQIKYAFRDYATDGVKSSGLNDVDKPAVREVGPLVEAAVALVGAAGLASVSFDTKANLDADLAYAADTYALVYGDATSANNDLYIKSGASGAGGWTLTGTNGIIHDIIDTLAQPYVDAANAAATSVSNAIDTTFAPSVVAVPGLVDDADNIPVWLDNGLLDAIGVGPIMLAAISAGLSLDASNFAPRNCPTSTSLPIVTDGRSLWKVRGKAALLASAQTAQLKAVFTGDSYTEQTKIAGGLRDVLADLGYTKAGEGWIYIRPTSGGNQWNTVTLNHTGWSIWDVVDAGDPVTYGCGLDGHALYATGTAATLDLTVTGDELKIFYRRTAGTFRYRIDGGAWTSVTGDGTGQLGVVDVPGLTDASHLLEIDLTGNTDTAVLYGFYSSSTAVDGVIVSKAGNGGAAGNDYLLWADDYIQGPAAYVDADLVFVVLGTNDYRLATSNGVANSPTTCVNGIAAIVSNWQTACPGAAFVVVCPPNTNAAASSGYDLSEYRDAIHAWCVANGHEFVNLYDSWGAWADEDANSQFTDTLHPNVTGGRRIAQAVVADLLKIERIVP